MNENTQDFNTLSGSIRFSGGVLGGMMLFPQMMCVGLIGAMQPRAYSADLLELIRNNHLSFLRFINAGYDYLVPQWSMTFSNDDIKLGQVTAKDNTFHELFFRNDSYVNYIGYYINRKDLFSRFGFYCGIDYELRKFSIEYKSSIILDYHYWHTHNEIQSLVPSVGLRYRLISPKNEIDGFPFNFVIEAGISYAIVVNYKNDVDYSTDSWNNYSIDALNNGFRTSIGIAITTNKWGSLYLRWIKDLYNLYNNDYIATNVNGYLYNNEIKTTTSYISIGWSTFL